MSLMPSATPLFRVSDERVMIRFRSQLGIYYLKFCANICLSNTEHEMAHKIVMTDRSAN